MELSTPVTLNNSTINVTEVPQNCPAGCIAKLATVVCIVPACANIFVILRIVRNKHLHNPTFFAVASMALANFVFLVLNTASSTMFFLIYFGVYTISFGTRLIVTLGSIANTAWFISSVHVPLLSYVRYVMIVHPYKGNVWLTSRRTLIACGSVWFIGLAVFSVVSGLDIVYPGLVVNHTNIALIVSYILASLLTVSLQILQLCKLKVTLIKCRSIKLQKISNTDFLTQINNMLIFITNSTDSMSDKIHLFINFIDNMS